MNREEYSIKGNFLEHQGRKLFYLLLEPTAVEAHSSILFLPPFAEEMNKSRHIVASQARELAAAGNRVMLLDLTGCGDAGGDFLDASWQIWLQDAMFAADTLVTMGAGPLNLWGLRLGALLACELSRTRADVQKLMLWQPVLNGEQQIDQFLRLRTVSTAVNSTVTFDRKTLWSELRAGRSMEIAGYELSSSMALEMAKARLSDLKPVCHKVHWLEIGALSRDSFSVASESVIAHWEEQGGEVDKGSVLGDPFWRTVDAVINLSLQQSTSEAFAQT
jgi:exosortase A-associated hydrolase 2